MADPIVETDLVKAHLRVFSTTENTLIEQYIAAAQEHIENYIDGVIPGSSDDVGDPDADPVVPPLADEVPKPIIQALLLLVTDMYDNRGAQVIGTIVADNPALVRLLFPYRQNLGV